MTMQEALPTKGAAAGYSPSPQQEEAVMHLGVVHTIRDRAAWDRVFFSDVEFPPGFGPYPRIVDTGWLIRRRAAA